MYRDGPTKPPPRRRLLLAALACAAAIAPALATPAAAAPGELALVSRATGNGAAGDAQSWHPSVSADGRYVAFASDAGNLSAEDGPASDVFVRDTLIGGVTLVSRADGPAGAGGNRRSHSPSISADGRYVAFVSEADNLQAINNDAVAPIADVFVRDLELGRTTLISRPAGVVDAANGPSARPSISAGGQLVAFESTADNLSALDDDRHANVFVRHMPAATTTPVGYGDGPSLSPAISADGRRVAFASDADDLSDTDDDRYRDVFVVDVDTGVTTLVSVTNEGLTADGDSGEPALSGDGSVVAFTSTAANLAPGDVAGSPDVFVADANRVRIVSRRPGSLPATGSGPSLAWDGRHVAFESASDDLGDADRDGTTDVWVADLRAGAFVLASRATGRGDVPGDAASTGAALSGDGRAVAFASDASNLHDADDDGVRDVFRWELEPPQLPPSGAIDLVSAVHGSTVDGSENEVLAARITADSRYVIFESLAVDVIEDPFDDSQLTRQHVYRRDLSHARTEAVSVGPSGALAAGSGAVASADGRFIAYFGDQGIFLRDMDAGTTQLVDHRWDDPNDWADGFHEPGLAITPDGRYVAYRSDSSDLVEPGEDDNDGADLYRWDRVTGTTTLVSAADGGSSAVRTTVGRDAAPVMSDDGLRLLFWSYSAAVVPGFEDRNDFRYESLYWRDVATGQTRLVDGFRGSATRSSNGAVRRALLSADGSIVAFDSWADDLLTGYEGGGGDVYLRDITVGGDEPALVSSRLGSPVMGGSDESQLRALTPDGRLVAFNSRARDLLPEDSSSPNDGYVRRFTGTTPDGPVRLVAGSTWWLQANGEPRPGDGGTDVQAVTPDGRYALVYSESTDLTVPRTDGESGDLFRADLQTGDVVHVTRAGRTGPDAGVELESGSVSADGQAAAFLSDAQNLVYGFVDGVPTGGEDPDGRSGPDAYAWSAQTLDAPPRAIAGARQDGPLTVRFDGSASSDAEGPIVGYAWDFGDGATGVGARVTHRYAEPGTYTATLTVTDGSDGTDTTTVEAKVYPVLAHGDEALELVGIDDHLGCFVRQAGVAMFDACGTFVHLDDTLYGPPGMRDGVVPVTPVSQSARSGTGDPADPYVITTTVQLGEAGPLLTQRDSYVEGRPYYRTRVTLVSEGSFNVGTVYRAGECRSGGESGSGTAHDPATHTAICSQNLGDLALVPLSPGAHHDAVDMGQVWSTMAEGTLPGDRCYCVGTIGEAIAVGWRAELGYGAPAVQESLAAFPVDGRLPVLVSLQAERPEATALGPNAFTFTARNPNSSTALLDVVEFALGGNMLYQPGTTSGLTTADPSVSEGLARWTGAFGIRAHDAATLRFGVTHGAGQGTVVARALAFPVAGWWVAGPAEPDGVAEARVAVGPGEAGAPETRITAGPGAATRDPRPAIAFAADRGGATFECRLGESAFAPCASPRVLGPLADGSYAFVVRAVAGGVRDGTPATREFRVDTLAPNTRIISGPRPVSNDATPVFEISAGEADAELECRIDAGAFAACASPYTSPPLADGAHVFTARAVDAAGNADASPASRAFTVDTVAPDTAFDDGSEVAARLAMAPGRRDVPVVGDGPALRVDCPAEASSSCSGTVTVATSTALVAVEPFTAAPGTTVPVEPTLPGAVQNEVEREGRVGVTLTVSTSNATDGQPVIATQRVALTPDPRTAWLRDAGTEVELNRGAAKLRLTCARSHAGPCRGEIVLRDGSAARLAQAGRRRGLGAVRFAVRRARGSRVRLGLTQRGRRLVRRGRSLRVAVTVRTRRRGARPVTKRRSLTLTVRGARP